MNIPIYIITGLLDSGKTTLFKEIANEILDRGRTLLILTEEGEVEYDELFLSKYNIEIVRLDNPSQLNSAFWSECQRKRPRQMVIEYNGMWSMDALFDSGVPDNQFIYAIYSTVNADTVDLYMTNMRQQFLEPLKDSNLVIFNRCNDGHDKIKFRRIVKAVNPPAQTAFEREDGVMYDDFEDVMPFDYSGDIVTIEDMDYGLWYLDAQEHPGRYIGKEIDLRGRFCESEDTDKLCFVIGRHVMTCCENDIQFMGYICYCDSKPTFNHGDWVNLKARFDHAWDDIYQDEAPILHLIDIEPSDTPDIELVTFS